MGLDGIGATLESTRSRELIDKLREHGLDKHVELPQVAIMGDTSSGKSSVLTALSGITFPSSSELTTRCPTQLVLSYAAEFSGFVTLQRYGQNSAATIVKPTQIFSKSEITDEIERLTKVLIAEGQEISDDSIVIKVSGPEFPNLTLIDLPGLVHTVESEEKKSMIPRIRALVTRYLTQARTVILAVVPGNVDFHNSEILQLAESDGVDPDGNRTQAIITKLDLIDQGAEEGVVDLLLNKKKVLKLGYHAVKCRGQKDLNDGVTIEKGIQNEELFFETSPSWNSKYVPDELKGIRNLREKLVLLLEEIILLELPNVIREIDVKLEECEGKLHQLGEPMCTESARRVYYSKCKDSYVDRTTSALKGTYDDSNFFREVSETSEDNRFRALVRKNEETFRKEISSRLHKHDYVKADPKDLSIGDGVEVMRTYPPNEEHHGYILHKERDARFYYIRVLKDDGTTGEFNSTDCEFRRKSLSKIKEMIESNRGDELSIFPSYPVFCSIVRNYVGSWEKPTMDLFHLYDSALSRVSTRAIEGLKFNDSTKNFLQSKISAILDELKGLVRSELGRKLESERMRPYTLNHYLIDNFMKKRHEPLLNSIRALDNPSGAQVSVTAVLAILENFGVGKSSNEDYVAQETEHAVSSYIKVASKRFIDEIPRLLNDYLLDPFLKLVKEQLNVTDATLATLLAEKPRIVRERERLNEVKTSLRASKEEVLKVKM